MDPKSSGSSAPLLSMGSGEIAFTLPEIPGSNNTHDDLDNESIHNAGLLKF